MDEPGFEFARYGEQQLRERISMCQDMGHVQQVAFSTYHDGITQVCFACGTVRSTIDVAIGGSDGNS